MDQFSFSDIVKFTNDVVIVTTAGTSDDPEQRIVYVNQAFENLTEYSKEDVIGKSPRLLQGKETSEETRKKMRIALQKRESIQVEILNYSKSGREYWLDVRLFPLKNAENEVTHFVAIERDITERLKSEKQNAENEARLRSIISSMSEGIVVQDNTGFIELCNDAAESILGLTKDQMMGRTSIDPRWMSIYENGSPFPGDEHPAMVTLSTGEALDDVVMGVNKPDDATTWISINSRPIYINNTGKPDAVVATFRDITTQTNANQIKSDFISTVSHELRTPLTSIRGSLGLLNGGILADLPSTVSDMLTVAERNCDRLIELINDLLDFEKLSAGKMDLAFSSIDLVTLLNNAIEANQPYADKFGIQIELRKSPEQIILQIDERRILQVLANFLSNASKFSATDSTVIIEYEKLKDDHVKVMVKDKGPGVPSEFENRLFDRFSQADGSDTRSKGGTGLGLAISKSLIERHNGEIGFINDSPTGATFYFTIPLDCKNNEEN